jgi:hypothetical protein
MRTDINITVIRNDIYQQVPIEDLTDDELQDLLKRAAPTQLRAYCSLLVRVIREHISRENAAPLAREVAKHVKKKR